MLWETVYQSWSIKNTIKRFLERGLMMDISFHKSMFNHMFFQGVCMYLFPPKKKHKKRCRTEFPGMIKPGWNFINFSRCSPLEPWPGRVQHLRRRLRLGRLHQVWRRIATATHARTGGTGWEAGWHLTNSCSRWSFENDDIILLGGTCFICPYIGNNHPNWLIFSERLKPPTRY